MSFTNFEIILSDSFNAKASPEARTEALRNEITSWAAANNVATPKVELAPAGIFVSEINEANMSAFVQKNTHMFKEIYALGLHQI